MTVTIRDAREGDLPAITEIYRDCVETGTATYELTAPDGPEMARRFAAIVRRGCPYIVAEDETGTVLGYAYASAFRDRPAYNWIVEDSIYLGQAARRRGVGRQLLEALLSRSEALGFRQMVAVIGGADPGSIGVHTACGFDLVGRMPGTGYKFGRWLDTVIMQKALGEGLSAAADPDAYPGTLRPGG